MSTIILIHGGSHGGGCWERVGRCLEAKGHKALWPDLPGMGNDTTPLSEITMGRWARFVADLAMLEREPVCLVGHSRGGIVISEAAELVPDAVSGLVYVTAFLLPAGSVPSQDLQSVTPELLSAIKPSPDNISMTVDPVAAEELFYHRANKRDREEAAAQLCPEPIAPNLEPMGVTAERWGRVPRAYIECTDDRAMSIELQRKLQMDLPCDPVITMDSDHSPFICKPEELAGHLIDISEVFSGKGRD